MYNIIIQKVTILVTKMGRRRVNNKKKICSYTEMTMDQSSNYYLRSSSPWTEEE